MAAAQEGCFFQIKLESTLTFFYLGYSLRDEQIEALKSFVSTALLTDFCRQEYVTFFVARIGPNWSKCVQTVRTVYKPVHKYLGIVKVFGCCFFYHKKDVSSQRHISRCLLLLCIYFNRWKLIEQAVPPPLAEPKTESTFQSSIYLSKTTFRRDIVHINCKCQQVVTPTNSDSSSLPIFFSAMDLLKLFVAG